MLTDSADQCRASLHRVVVDFALQVHTSLLFSSLFTSVVNHVLHYTLEADFTSWLAILLHWIVGGIFRMRSHHPEESEYPAWTAFGM